VTPALEGSLQRLEAEQTVSRLLGTTCAELVDLLEAAGCTVSRVIGDLLVELSACRRGGEEHPLGLYLADDYPLTREVLERDEPRTVRRGDPDADPAEVALLEKLGFDSLLMLPLRSRGARWGLVEIYGEERDYLPEQIELASTVADRVGRRLSELEGGEAPTA
jgi:GAF domain-containing protein